MSLSSVDSNISALLNNKSFIVPQNQRKYVWKKNNWEELIEDIDLVYKQIKPNHFIGSVVLKTAHRDDGIRSHFSIIDGQQRVLTLTILIATIGYSGIFLQDTLLVLQDLRLLSINNKCIITFAAADITLFIRRQ